MNEKILTVGAVYKTLEEMRGIYPYRDEETSFNVEHDICKCINSVISIRTIDKETGIIVNLSKDATEGGAT